MKCIKTLLIVILSLLPEMIAVWKVDYDCAIIYLFQHETPRQNTKAIGGVLLQGL